jgi:Fungal Zn(2)-Cys(6) binuclear cluster domain
MVGVPGRSKGCHTCRKRKIGCSQERPYCFNCIKSSRVCTGYQRDRVFIIKDLSTEANKDALTKTSSPLVKLLGAKEETNEGTRSAYGKATETWTTNRDVHWSVAQELSPYALWRQQLLGTFLSSQSSLGGSESKAWIV